MPEFNFPEWRITPEPPAPEVPPEYAEADAVREQQLNDQFLAGQRQILNHGEGVYYRRQGEAAIHAAPPAVEALQQLKDDTLAQSGNDRQREALTKRLDWHHGEARRGIARHLAGQADAWRQTVADNQVKTAEEEAAVNHNDPAKVDLFAAGAYNLRLRSTGQPPESEAAQATAAEARSAVYRRAIEAALAVGDIRSAIGLYERSKDRLTGDDAAPMQGQIKAVTQPETARDYVTGLELPTPGAPSTFLDAPKQLADADAAHQAATARNDADWAYDPSQRTINQHYIDVRFGEQKQAIATAKDELDGAVSTWIATPRPDGRPQTDLPPPVLWAQLSPDEQQNVLSALKRNGGAPQTQTANEPSVISDASSEPLKDGQQLAQAGAGSDPGNQAAMSKEGRQNVPTDWAGERVFLPTGLTIPDQSSPTGKVMSPVPDLGPVAAAGRETGTIFRTMLTASAFSAPLAAEYLRHQLKANVGQGGAFDYQRQADANSPGQFIQLRQFRNVSNVNVGLFCQQAGLSLHETLQIAGIYAAVRSSNADPSRPYGLDERTKHFIEVGHELGKGGAFGSSGSFQENR